MGKFWNGTIGKAHPGLEVGCLGFVDAEAGTALHALAEQTPSPATLKKKGITLIGSYLSLLKKHLKEIKPLTRYLAVDG